MSATLTTRSVAVARPKHSGSDGILGGMGRAMYTVDDLLFNRSQTIPDVALVAYPATGKSRADYIHYTAKDLDRFADYGAKKYASMGLIPQVRSPSTEKQHLKC